MLLLVASLMSGSGTVALGMVRGDVDIGTGLVGLAKGWAFGFYYWDQIGADAVAKFDTGAVAKITAGVVVLVYLMMLRLFYAISWALRDLVRRKGMVSRTRARIMCFITGIIGMAVVTWGFAFPRAIVDAVTKLAEAVP